MDEIIKHLDNISNTSKTLSEDITQVNKELETVREQINNESVLIEKVIQKHESIIRLDVGGTLFTTSITTLQMVPDTMLSAMFSGRHKIEARKDGSYFIDRDGTHFRWILNFLRDTASIENLEDKTILNEVLLEAEYYNIKPLVERITYKLRKHKIHKVMHISNKDQYSPVEDMLSTSRIRVKLLEKNTDWESTELGTIDAILVTAYSGTNPTSLGNFLANFVDNGGNVVLCLFSNSTQYEYPQGRFLTEHYYPLNPGIITSDGAGKTLGTVHATDHEVMDGVRRISVGTEQRRGSLSVSTVGQVARIADWSDGHPLIAIRTDKNGYVTTITYSIGIFGGKEDAIRLVQNALTLRKQN